MRWHNDLSFIKMHRISLVPRPICGRGKNGLVSIVCACAGIPDDSWGIGSVRKLSVKFFAILYAHALLLRACRRQQFVTSWPIVCPAHAALSNGSLSRARRLERDA